jgi:hypothetical protein
MAFLLIRYSNLLKLVKDKVTFIIMSYFKHTRQPLLACALIDLY